GTLVEDGRPAAVAPLQLLFAAGAGPVLLAVDAVFVAAGGRRPAVPDRPGHGDPGAGDDGGGGAARQPLGGTPAAQESYVASGQCVSPALRGGKFPTCRDFPAGWKPAATCSPRRRAPCKPP